MLLGKVTRPQLEPVPGAPSGGGGERLGSTRGRFLLEAELRSSLSSPRGGRLDRLAGDISTVRLPEGMLRRLGELD